MNERNNQGVRVAINHVSKDFPVDNGRMNVLNDIDMEIKPGEFISIVGSSGCGKSTLLKILGGLQSPTEGEAYVGDRMVKSSSVEVGMIFQESRLFP